MARLKRVPGLDYLAEPGDDPDISFGVVQTIGPEGRANSMEASVCRRLFPHDRPADPTEPWQNPTCFYWEVLLPRGTSDEFWRDPQALSQAYDAAAFPGLRDRVINLTLRVPQLESSGRRIHEYHQIVTGFARAHLVERGLPTIAIIHVPSRAAMPGPIHWHCLIAARRWSPITGPSTFCRDLLAGGRAVIEGEWRAWKELQGL